MRARWCWIGAVAWLSCCRLDSQDWPAVKEGIGRRYPSVVTISTRELSLWLARPDTGHPILLDARSHDEHAVSHLRGAHHAATVDDALKVLQGAALDTPIVTYCAVGYRSAQLADRLRLRGYTGVVNLEGSLFSWANEGRPLWRGATPTALVHPYGEPWAGLLDESRRATAPVRESAE